MIHLLASGIYDRKMSIITPAKYESLSQSDEYSSFRSKVPLRKICVDQVTGKVSRLLYIPQDLNVSYLSFFLK